MALETNHPYMSFPNGGYLDDNADAIGVGRNQAKWPLLVGCKFEKESDERLGIKRTLTCRKENSATGNKENLGRGFRKT